MTLVTQSIFGTILKWSPATLSTDFVRHRIHINRMDVYNWKKKRLHKLTVLVHLYGISDSFEIHFLFQSYPTRTFYQHALLQKSIYDFSIPKKNSVFGRIFHCNNMARHRPQANKQGGATVDCIVEAGRERGDAQQHSVWCDDIWLGRQKYQRFFFVVG